MPISVFLFLSVFVPLMLRDRSAERRAYEEKEMVQNRGKGNLPLRGNDADEKHYERGAQGREHRIEKALRV